MRLTTIAAGRGLLFASKANAQSGVTRYETIDEGFG
ncbi:hypothetical protein P3T40_002888 [Paraburkholderia sp. EB58]|jgi:hypothetical protein